ncbi:MAG TPA: PLDc_N domain-containing protein [Bacteroidetes bacterium]|nr:PLDc_N domain-containing protein [Bacteroidota bacterium]
MELSIDVSIAVIPFVILNLSLVFWCIIDWRKRNQFAYFQKPVWLIFILFIQLIGPILYLLIGRKENDD